MMRSVIVIILTGFMLFSSQPAFACSCMRSEDVSLAEILKATDAVFVGRVLTVETSGYKWVVKVQVIEAFFGIEPGEVTIYTNLGSNACGYNFTAGETYLIYAEKYSSITEMKGGKLSVSKCGRTKPLPEAGEDIAAIKELLTGDEASLASPRLLLPKTNQDVKKVECSHWSQETWVAMSQEDGLEALSLIRDSEWKGWATEARKQAPPGALVDPPPFQYRLRVTSEKGRMIDLGICVNNVMGIGDGLFVFDERNNDKLRTIVGKYINIQ